MDSSNCQTLTASPAEPGGLPHWTRLLLRIMFQAGDLSISVMRDRLFRPLRSPGDCDEWRGVCSKNQHDLHRDELLHSVTSTTFAEGEYVDR